MTDAEMAEPMEIEGDKSWPFGEDPVGDKDGAGGFMVRTPTSPGLAFLAVVVCGTLNNFAYCIISGASQDLTEHFGMAGMTTLPTAVMNGSSLLATLISTKYLVKFAFYTRVLLVIFLSVVAYAGVAACTATKSEMGFWISVLMSSLGGMALVFGESTNLNFLKNFPPSLLGGWGAGTGIAGIAGSGVYMLLRKSLGLSMTAVFSMCAPLGALYWVAFSYLHSEATAGVVGPRLARAIGGVAAAGSLAESQQNSLRESLQDCGSAPATFENMKAAIRASGSIMFNLVAVYFLEYSIHPGLSDRETLCSGSTMWFSTMWMCYNIGVTLSRFSVSLFRIRRVWILTALQVMNVVGWVVEVKTGVVRDSLPNDYGYIIMAIWMVFVGLCGGAVYANCMHLFNTDETIPEGLRELGINLGFVMSNIGITLATTLPSVYYNIEGSFFSKDVLYPDGCGVST